ncbi:MAG: hypothetical protein ABEL51_02055, partial [Salinibacter sp.]
MGFLESVGEVGFTSSVVGCLDTNQAFLILLELVGFSLCQSLDATGINADEFIAWRKCHRILWESDYLSVGLATLFVRLVAAPQHEAQ